MRMVGGREREEENGGKRKRVRWVGFFSLEPV
jgi:hypothetical protein